MARFKVGDRVKYNGKLATVIAPYMPYISDSTDEKCWTLLFDRAGDFKLAHDGDMGPEYSGRCWYVRDDNSNVEPLTAVPAVPDGWTPASEPPKEPRDARNVEVVLQDGKHWYGWYNDITRHWSVFDDNSDVDTIKSDCSYSLCSCHAALGEVIAWREIQPEPERLKVGQRVRVKDNPRVSRWYKAGDVGVVSETSQSNPNPRIKFDNGKMWWCYADDLEPEPEPVKSRWMLMGDGGWCVECALTEAEAVKYAIERGPGTLVARVVYEVRPGKPEVIKVEGK